MIGAVQPDGIGKSFYAEILDPHQFSNTVPIYLPEGEGYIESLGYDQVRNKPNPPWQSSIRKISDDAFFTILHLAKVGLDAGKNAIFKASDLNTDTNGETERRYQYVSRIIRDIHKARDLKSLYEDHCQICDDVIQLANGSTYSEGHHIRPLGRDHDGPDSRDNILVLCPNHHALCDYFAIRLNIDMLNIHSEHAINPEYIAYHNKQHERQLSHRL